MINIKLFDLLYYQNITKKFFLVIKAKIIFKVAYKSVYLLIIITIIFK